LKPGRWAPSGLNSGPCSKHIAFFHKECKFLIEVSSKHHNPFTQGAIMEFEAIRKETVMLNPKQGLAERRIPSEVRIDPLTGRTARICHFMKLQWEKPDFDALVAGTDQWCPFCADKVLHVTPCFPEKLIAGGRLQQNDRVIFPNIAPYDSIGAVATFGARHYIPMTDFTPELIASAFGFALEFFRHVERTGDPESVYHIINWNYMPPSGSSLIHPHLQVFSSSSAPNLMRQELEASKRYQQERGANYWEDLVAAEKQSGKRYLGQIGRTHWLTAFAPMGVAGDVLAVTQDVCCTLGLNDRDLADIATGIVNVIAEYDKMGIYSFNMNFFTGAATDDHFRFHLLFSPRTFFSQKLGTPDVGALRNLFNETLCMAYPEEINELLKPGFDQGRSD
jgi:galactose-1-phosphate uridylyltransferase